MSEAPTSSHRTSRHSFAHASEAELARILTYYDVRWEYEPDTFPIGWTLDGEVVESFSPDFYLPDLDLYVELTTLKQSLVRKKNRKLRRLRELYPDVRIKLFYARDFRMLLLKFGRLALADELSGTTGQATPPRTPAAGATAEAASRPPDGSVDAGPAEAPGDGREDATASGTATRSAADDGAAATAVAARLQTADAESGRTPRGRRRGRRRRAAARADQDAGSASRAVSGPSRGAGAVPSAGTLPA